MLNRFVNKKVTYMLRILLILGVSVLIFGAFGNHSSAAYLQNRFINISSSAPSATKVQYDIGFTLSSNQTIGSVVVEICSNSPMYQVACVSANGFSWVGGVLVNQLGTNNYIVNPNTTSSRLILSGLNSGYISGQNIQFSVSGVTNPAVVGTFYARIYTYASSDGTGLLSDVGGVAMSISNPVSLSTEVPPYLVFCSGLAISAFDCSSASGNYFNFGEYSSTNTSTASSQFIVGTNADSGYTVTVTGSEPTSGNNTITKLAFPTGSNRGISQFGINLRHNTDPGVGEDLSGDGVGSPTPDYNTPNKFKFTNNDVIASSSNETSQNKYTVSYIVNVSKNQEPGIYTNTILYTTLATF